MKTDTSVYMSSDCETIEKSSLMCMTHAMNDFSKSQFKEDWSFTRKGACVCIATKTKQTENGCSKSVRFLGVSTKVRCAK